MEVIIIDAEVHHGVVDIYIYIYSSQIIGVNNFLVVIVRLFC